MGEQNRFDVAPEGHPERERPSARRWTIWEIVGLLLSAILVASPVISLGYTFLFPRSAPAYSFWPTPTNEPSPGTPTPITPSPTGIVPTPTPTPVTPSPSPTPVTPSPSPTPVTATPVTPSPSPTPVTPTPTPTGGPGQLRITKAASRDDARPGDQIVFSIGLSNGTASQATVTVDDTLPANFIRGSIWHTCAGGSIELPTAQRFIARNLVVPAGQACQVIVSTVVSSGCECYVTNTAHWSATGDGSGDADSQPIYLRGGPTVTPVTPTGTATASPTPGGPTATPTRTPTSGPTPTSTRTPTSGPTPTRTPSIPVPTSTPEPRTPGPQPRRTPRPPAVPTVAPTPCAQARISGEVCAAGAKVTISSCCPQWQAQTTSDTSGHFEFAFLTTGTFTVQSQGRSRTVTLGGCDSAVRVNLCPVTPGPTSPATALPTTSPAGSPIPATVTPIPGGTEPPTTGDVTLSLESAHTGVRQGESLSFFLALHNWQATKSLQGIVIRCTFPDVLALQGAASASGDIQVNGQEVSLSLAQLPPDQELRLQVDASVRPDVPLGTYFNTQGMAQASGGVVAYSNMLVMEVVGEGTPGPGAGPSETTPASGGPQPPIAPTAGPSAIGGQMPYTGSGLPMVGMLLGGAVLLARQLRLRRSERRRG